MTSVACLLRETEAAMTSASMEKNSLCDVEKEQAYFMDSWKDTYVTVEHGCLNLTDAVVDGGDGADDNGD